MVARRSGKLSCIRDPVRSIACRLGATGICAVDDFLSLKESEIGGAPRPPVADAGGAGGDPASQTDSVSDSPSGRAGPGGRAASPPVSWRVWKVWG